MKKILLLLAFVLSGFSMAQAQVYVGGSLGVSHSKVDFGCSDQSGTSFKILPEVGYQLSDSWSIGLGFGFMKGYAALGALDPSDYKALANAAVSGVADVTSDDMVDLDLKAIHVAPYVRYTFWKPGKFEFFIDGMFGMNFVKGIPEYSGSTGYSSSDEDGDDEEFTSFEINFRPGVSYAVTDHIKLTARIGSLGYQHLKMKDSDLKVSRFGLDVDSNNLLFGLNYTF